MCHSWMVPSLEPVMKNTLVDDEMDVFLDVDVVVLDGAVVAGWQMCSYPRTLDPRIAMDVMASVCPLNL